MSKSVTYEKINKIYDEKGKNPVHALKDVSFTINPGELFCLLGPSGCGKTTLLRATAGLESISSGKMYYGDVDISTIPPYRRNIGMVFQSFALYPHMSIFENVAYGLRVRKIDNETVKKKVVNVMELVGLSEELKRNPSPTGLSGGQQQRVAIARALVYDPDVLLLDEPLANLDAKLRRYMRAEIRRIQKATNITTIFVTHDQDEAMIMSDKIHLMNNGVVEQSGNPVQLYTHPVSKFAAEFIGHYNILDNQQLKTLLPKHNFNNHYYAIRPETILLQTEPIQDSNMYVFEAVVNHYISRGNVLRYTLSCHDVIIKSEALFRSFTLFDEGQKVYVGIEPHNILEIRD